MSVIRHSDDMTRRIALALAALALTACGMTDATLVWVPDGYPPCTTEDAPGPCYWDARERGNGQGTSFVVDADDVVTYVYTNE